MRDDDLIAALRDAPGPGGDSGRGPDGGADARAEAGVLGDSSGDGGFAPVDPQKVVALARQRRGRRTAALSCAAALLVVGAAVGLGSEVLPRAASGPASQADSAAAARDGQAADSAGGDAGAAADARAESAAGGSGTAEQRAAAAGTLACPTSITWPAEANSPESGMPVPATPTFPDGGDPAGRLVPTEAPTKALVCQYQSDQDLGASIPGMTPEKGWPLTPQVSGSANLTGGLDRIPEDLAWLPRMSVPPAQRGCTAVGGPTTPYLLGLQYRGGAIVWVSSLQDPNSCTNTTNGDFTSPRSIGAGVAEAFEQHRWPAEQPAEPCGGSGRLGSESVFIPERPSSAVLCVDGTPRPVPADVLTRLQRLLATAPVDPAKAASFSCTGPNVGPFVVSYEHGPSVWLMGGPTCSPQLVSAELGADRVPDEVWTLLERVAEGP